MGELIEGLVREDEQEASYFLTTPATFWEGPVHCLVEKGPITEKLAKRIFGKTLEEALEKRYLVPIEEGPKPWPPVQSA